MKNRVIQIVNQETLAYGHPSRFINLYLSKKLIDKNRKYLIGT